ncbi:hypothetical protein BDW74DRAFT_164780 [Aspergillus multicolor]|uniref:uncharacterized protein n=1 Tax=Aspergillus multicolor TaxID=41759 RepID=UPI003CCCA8D9
MPSRATRGLRLLSNYVKPTLPRISVRPFTISLSREMEKGASQSIFADCDPEILYTYSAQRWLWNEKAQLARRYVRFNLDALIKIAEHAAESDAICTNITKLQEGDFNKVFLATMKDGKEVVVKIPNPNAGRKHYTTVSEVATMEYVREKLHVSVPKVLGYCSRAQESSLGAEFIVMEKAPGVELARVWDRLKGREKVAIVKQVAAITGKLANARFPAHSALYNRADVAALESIPVNEDYAIGPTVGRAWFDDRRGEFNTSPRDTQQGIFNGPNWYHPTKESKLSVLNDFLKIPPYIIPKPNPNPKPKTRVTEISSGTLWHPDIHTHNIFVDESLPSQITSIFDWQAAPISPLFLSAHHPSLLEFDGPQLERFTKPKSVKQLFLSQFLWLTYEIEVKRQVSHLHAFRYRETLPGQILGLIGSIFDDGEPYVQSLLSDLVRAENWKALAPNEDAVCPLQYSEQELADQRTQLEKWSKDGWNSAVPPSDYDGVVRRLAAAKERFLGREAKNELDRKAWLAVWPFHDTPEE